MSFSDPKNALILVVDDLKENLCFLAELLELEEYKVICASNGEEALTIINKYIPDLILLDLMMPKMSGIEMCKKLKSNAKFKEIPIIFLTASHETDDLIKSFEAGAADYITKPFNLPELFARVRTHLDLKMTRDQLQASLKEQQKLAQKLEKLATTDSLTEIANRRHFLDLANKELHRTHRYSNGFSLLMLDLDYFKNINDTFGHGVGDEILKNMTKTTAECLRNVDIFGRLGGEEFAILLPETELSQAQNVAERIRKQIAQITFQVQDQMVSITVSIGITVYQAQDCKIEDILKRADHALYQAKKEGRNRIVVAPTFVADVSS